VVQQKPGGSNILEKKTSADIEVKEVDGGLWLSRKQTDLKMGIVWRETSRQSPRQKMAEGKFVFGDTVAMKNLHPAVFGPRNMSPPRRKHSPAKQLPKMGKGTAGRDMEFAQLIREAEQYEMPASQEWQPAGLQSPRRMWDTNPIIGYRHRHTGYQHGSPVRSESVPLSHEQGQQQSPGLPTVSGEPSDAAQPPTDQFDIFGDPLPLGENVEGKQNEVNLIGNYSHSCTVSVSRCRLTTLPPPPPSVGYYSSRSLTPLINSRSPTQDSSVYSSEKQPTTSYAHGMYALQVRKIPRRRSLPLTDLSR
jgi:hypothetical protein